MAAESKTAAELVPVVAAASGRYHRPQDLVGLWLGVVGMGLVGWLAPDARGDLGSWGGLSPLVKLVAMGLAVVVGFFLGVLAAHRIAWLRRLFTPRRQMRDELLARARKVFFDARIRRTKNGTGILIYVSLFERMAAVLGDQTIMDRLGQPALDALCSQLTDGLKRGSPTDALVTVIRSAGEKLAPVLPRPADDADELPDALITID